MKKRILILGGTGYLGSRVAAELATDAEVCVASRSLSPTKEAWLRSLQEQLKWQAFDSQNATALPGSGTWDAVLNFSIPSAGEAAKNFSGALGGALRTAAFLGKALRDGTAGRVLHFSSFHVYGKRDSRSYGESDTLAPTSPYGKLHAEVERSLQLGNFATLAISRLTNVIGPPAHTDLGPQAGLFFLDLVRKHAAGEGFSLRNDGSAQRDFLCMSDFLAWVRVLLRAEPAVCGVFNCGRGQSMSLRQLTQSVQDQALASGLSSQVQWGTESDLYNEPFRVDVQRAQGVGFRVSDNLTQEIQGALKVFRRAA